MLTSDPYSLISLLKLIAVSDVVTVAVKMEIITRPIMIQTKEKARAKNERGERSPYLQEKKKINGVILRDL